MEKVICDRKEDVPCAHSTNTSQETQVYSGALWFVFSPRLGRLDAMICPACKSENNYD
jgi:hypothetical protein